MTGPIGSAGLDVRASDLLAGVGVAAFVGLATLATVLLAVRLADPAPDEPDGAAAITVAAARRGDPGVPAAAASESASKRQARPRSRKTAPRETAPSEPREPSASDPRPRDERSRDDRSHLSSLPSPDGATDPQAPATGEGEPAAPAGATDLPGLEDLGEGGGGGSSNEGAAALASYRKMLRRFIAQRYRVLGSGLSPDELADKRVELTLEIDDARTIQQARAAATGNAAFDDAATRALASLTGETLPEPPPGYPGPLQRELRVTFICKPEACD